MENKDKKSLGNLLRAGADVRCQRESSYLTHRYLLTYAVVLRRCDLTSILLTFGADPNDANIPTTHKPLRLAIDSRQPEMAHLLLRWEASPQLCGSRLLGLAAKNRDDSIAQGRSWKPVRVYERCGHGFKATDVSAPTSEETLCWIHLVRRLREYGA